MTVPKLRFKEFDSKYDQISFEKLKGFSIKSGKSNNKEENGEYPFYGSTGIIGYKSDYDYAGKAILIARVGANAGSLYQVNGKYSVSDNTLILNASDTTNLDYVRELLVKFNLSKLVFGTGQPLVTGGLIKKILVLIPEVEEQTKIASFLSAVDDKISQLTQEHELLDEYKKGIIQQFFSRKIRFKANDGSNFEDWTKIQLNKISTRVTRKNKEGNQNPLTISAQMGLVNQQKYFNKQVASKDLSKYYLLHKGEYAYNKSYSAGYPMGAIKRLENYDKGAVSTLYICFSLSNEVSSDFFEHYVESGALVTELAKIAQEGARNHGLLNVGVKEFFDINLLIPCQEEQIKIAKFLSTIDQKIDNIAVQINQAKVWKKGLLQQLFV